MNQYVNSNHTKSDDINSDIRAILALQQQADACQTQVDYLSEELIQLSLTVQALQKLVGKLANG